LEISEIQTSRIIIKGLEIAAISIKLPEIGEEGSLVKPIHKGFCYWLDIGVRWAHLFLNFRRFKDTLGSFGLIVKVNFSLPRQSVGQSVVLHNKLGGGLANLEPVGRPIYGHAVFNNKLNQLFSLLDGTSLTLLVMTVWDFLSSPSLLYDSSTSLRDISFIYYKQLIFKKIKATTQRSTL